jgi:hypothetical protein
MTLEKRVSNLENLVASVISMYGIKTRYNEADKSALRQTSSQQGEEIKTNTVGINENDTAVCDVAELSDVNSQAIDDLAEMVDELAQKIAEMEG